ncbi:hypothetical protein ACPUYX_20500 [Desulfosporosinus sp. SYSU MS00001]|uniref:hypothetical protein n=1 Tax=Desulfosporosinus sp. SYSU MS00001 TaxID=3416284 RepID=UPI003CF3829C
MKGWRLVIKKIILALVISILLNVGLIYNFIINTERLNTTWYNLTSNLANSINEDTNGVDSEDTVFFEEIAIKNIQLQLDNLQLLPEGSLIIESKTIENMETLFKYQFPLLDQMKKEIQQNGKISASTNEKYKKAQQNRVAIAKSFSSQLKTVDPFAPVFIVNKWRTIFENAINRQNTTVN